MLLRVADSLTRRAASYEIPNTRRERLAHKLLCPKPPIACPREALP